MYKLYIILKGYLNKVDDISLIVYLKHRKHGRNQRQ